MVYMLLSGSNPVQAWIFFQVFFFQTAKVAYITAMIFPHIINFLSQVIRVFLLFFGYVNEVEKKEK